uniref:UDP-glucose 4-epimerase n=1 Tax=Magnetococcus massalia (strain MO-1) TaxID=451514 RepID=A0A1S7LF99_MAGMO|nr:UDP-glucose 4-epimerase (UDP-galactose 4-epimerase) (Galactowaldenase) [Candidatus Magnetococcus massalia]
MVGGAGYIGSHVCKQLKQKGFTPVVYDNLSTGHRALVKWGPFAQGELEDEARLSEVMTRYKAVAVMHFAASSYVGESVTNPEKYYMNNVLGTLKLLRVMRRHDLNTLIFSSTCATYGEAKQIPIPLDHPQAPINPYGVGKRLVEQVLEDYAHAYGFKSISLRYFNAAGSDALGESYEKHLPETHLIPLAIQAALNPQSSLTLFGEDYETPDGSCIRDYIHVTDLADAHILSLQALLDGQPTRLAYNLGNGTGFSVKEVIQCVEKVTGKKVAVVSGERREGDPPILIGDAKEALQELHWKPQHSSLENIVSTAVTGYSKAYRDNGKEAENHS